jgi:hypothetical protein
MTGATQRRRQRLRDELAVRHQQDLKRTHPSTYAFRVVQDKHDTMISCCEFTRAALHRLCISSVVRNADYWYVGRATRISVARHEFAAGRYHHGGEPCAAGAPAARRHGEPRRSAWRGRRTRLGAPGEPRHGPAASPASFTELGGPPPAASRARACLRVSCSGGRQWPDREGRSAISAPALPRPAKRTPP